MSTITEYRLDDMVSWDVAVRSVHESSVFCMAEYVKAFAQENPENGTPFLLVYENGDDKAVCVLFRRDIADDPHFRGKVEHGRYVDLITPYGYGGFAGHVNDWGQLNQTYSSYCREKHAVCEFVRFDLFSVYAEHYAGETESRTHNVVRSLDLSMDEIWMDFKPKVRKNVKRAQQNGLSMVITSTDEYLEDFLRIYYDTMTRSEADEHFFFSESFFRTLNEMRDNIMYFYAVYQGQVVSAELVIYDTRNCYSYLGGTDSAFFDVRPNDFLKYHVIQWAKERGLQSFVLGGGYGSDDGIFQYKLCLAPHGVKDFYIGRRIFDQDTYDLLVGLRGDEIDGESRFFPLYRS